MTELRFTAIDFAAAEPILSSHLSALAAPVDSFFEDHVRDSQHYRIQTGETVIGWTAVHEESLITQFGLFSPHRQLGQRAFAQVRKLEQVQNALVPTCDEFYLSHALDDYRLLEKQAYQFQLDPQRARFQTRLALTHRPATPDDVALIVGLSDTFFDDLDRRVRAGQLYLAWRGADCVGIGVIEPSIFTAEAASIGMFTAESFRHQGVGAALIAHLIDVCHERGLRPVAGCWYYNHQPDAPAACELLTRVCSGSRLTATKGGRD